MKRIISVLFVTFAFGAATLLAAQEVQTASPPNAPAVANSANPTGAVATEPARTSADQQPAATPVATSNSPETGRNDAEKPAMESTADPAQNVIEFGGPG